MTDIQEPSNDVKERMRVVIEKNATPIIPILETLKNVEPSIVTPENKTPIAKDEKDNDKSIPVVVDVLEQKKKEDAIIANAEIESKMKQDLLLKTIPDFLKDEVVITPVDKKAPSETKDYESEIAKVHKEYEIYESDQLLKTIAEWRKNGGTDLNEFIKETGLIDVSKVSMEDLFKSKAKEYELDETELKDYIDEQMDKYEGMNKVDKKEFEKKIRTEYHNKVSEKAQNLVQKKTAQSAEENKFYTEELKKAQLQLKTVTDTLKEYKGFPIDEKRKKEIFDNTPVEYCYVYDKEGKFLGMDAEKGTTRFIEERYRKDIDKSLYTTGWTAGYDAAFTERNRIAENPSGQITAVKSTNPYSDARAEFNKTKGIKN